MCSKKAAQCFRKTQQHLVNLATSRFLIYGSSSIKRISFYLEITVVYPSFLEVWVRSSGVTDRHGPSGDRSSCRGGCWVTGRMDSHFGGDSGSVRWWWWCQIVKHFLLSVRTARFWSGRWGGKIGHFELRVGLTLRMHKVARAERVAGHATVCLGNSLLGR